MESRMAFWFNRLLSRMSLRYADGLLMLLFAATVCLLYRTNELQAKLEQATSLQIYDNELQLENGIPFSSKKVYSSMTSDNRMQYDFMELNVTKYAKKDTLFFNRVPKVGSQTTMQLLKRLSYRNHFNFHKDYPQKVELIRLRPPQEKRLCSLVNVFRPPAVYIKHVCFLEFERYNFSSPIYFNMVRDPVERVISWYYYVRAPWYFVERKRSFPELELPDTEWLRKDFEQCVLTNDWECQYIQGDTRDLVGDHRRMTGFFCGMDDSCAEFNSLKAMQRAKRNVEKYYAVVGVLEEMNKTLSVLENYIPRFFQGATEIYQDETRMASMNSNTYKPPVAEHIKDIVRRNFTHEIEFYEFCKQRLHRQFSALSVAP